MEGLKQRREELENKELDLRRSLEKFNTFLSVIYLWLCCGSGNDVTGKKLHGRCLIIVCNSLHPATIDVTGRSCVGYFSVMYYYSVLYVIRNFVSGLGMFNKVKPKPKKL